jgi:hypothetical protein
MGMMSLQWLWPVRWRLGQRIKGVQAAIRNVIKRMDPTFDEANYECKSFRTLLKKYPNKVKKGQHDHLVSVIG